MKSFFILLSLTLHFISCEKVFAKSRQYAVTAQQYALAPNAGGQQVYSLRLSVDDRIEYSVFSNQYLMTGKYPLSGFIYDWRFPVCEQGCFLQSFAQIGVGLATAGPLVAITWNLTPFWLFRIDFSTHIYASVDRVIVWNYPFWLGLTVPF